MITKEINLGKVAPVGKKAWGNDATYDVLDIVSYQGQSYLSLHTDNVGNDPASDSDETHWMLLAERGESWYQMCVRTGRFEGTEDEFLNEKQKQIDNATTAAKAANESSEEALRQASNANEQANRARDIAILVEEIYDSIENAFAQWQAHEQARQNAELARSEAEKLRAQDEAIRASQENIRVLQEQERQTKESDRISKEEIRIKEEAIRMASEKDRISKENERIYNETVRKTAEELREQAKIECEQATEHANNQASLANDAAVLAQQKASLAQIAANSASAVAEEATAKVNEMNTGLSRLEELEATLTAKDRLQPTAMVLQYPKKITFGNTAEQRIEATLSPAGTGKNVLFLSDNRSVQVMPDGFIRVLNPGKSFVHAIPTENTAIYQTVEIEVLPTPIRLLTSTAMRLTSSGAMRLG